MSYTFILWWSLWPSMISRTSRSENSRGQNWPGYWVPGFLTLSGSVWPGTCVKLTPDVSTWLIILVKITFLKYSFLYTFFVSLRITTMPVLEPDVAKTLGVHHMRVKQHRWWTRSKTSDECGHYDHIEQGWLWLLLRVLLRDVLYFNAWQRGDQTVATVANFGHGLNIQFWTQKNVIAACDVAGCDVITRDQQHYNYFVCSIYSQSDSDSFTYYNFDNNELYNNEQFLKAQNYKEVQWSAFGKLKSETRTIKKTKIQKNTERTTKCIQWKIQVTKQKNESSNKA